MRELLVEMLVELKQPAQALKEFELSLHEARNRMRSYYGAARSRRWQETAQKLRSITAGSSLIDATMTTDHAQNGCTS